MKKIFSLFLLIGIFTLTACSVETGVSTGSLTADGSQFATMDDSGAVTKKEDAVFSAGDQIVYVLQNVGPFKKGDDGLNKFEMDLSIIDGNGTVIFNNENMLGDNGHIDLANNIANSPYGVFQSSDEMPAGEYKMKLTIRDLLANAKLSKTSSFTITENTNAPSEDTAQ